MEANYRLTDLEANKIFEHLINTREKLPHQYEQLIPFQTCFSICKIVNKRPHINMNYSVLFLIFVIVIRYIVCVHWGVFSTLRAHPSKLGDIK